MENQVKAHNWWLYDWLFKILDDENLRALFEEAFDRWCWSSGNFQDQKLATALEDEILRRQILSSKQLQLELTCRREAPTFLMDDSEFVREFDGQYKEDEEGQIVPRNDQERTHGGE
jgi:hypothetical protein